MLSIYDPKTRVPTFVKETLLKFKSYIKSHALIVVDFNTPLSHNGQSARHKIKRETKQLSEIMTQMGSIDIYRTFHPNIPFFQHLLKPSLKLTTYSVTKQISTEMYTMASTQSSEDVFWN